MSDQKPKHKARIERNEIVGDSNNSQHKEISRRDVLKFISVGLAVVALSGSVRLAGLAQERSGILRPPGAMDEDHFRSLCLSCNKCQEVCPQEVIRPVKLTESLETAGSPTLSFAKNYCNLCMECTKICPTDALLPIRQSEARIGIAKVMAERCAPWLGNSCGHGCAHSCPFDAISMDGQNRPHIKSELCVGCGICVVACSLSANQFFTKGIVVFPIDSSEPG
ncbi:MAG: hypothetical protein BGO78_07430 [Chloroflexi bacterium 44-23]|nr:MAG: hypothetical protein BGO78_07430 [Chloroflexi bacterium 44-23]